MRHITLVDHDRSTRGICYFLNLGCFNACLVKIIVNMIILTETAIFIHKGSFANVL